MKNIQRCLNIHAGFHTYSENMLCYFMSSHEYLFLSKHRNKNAKTYLSIFAFIKPEQNIFMCPFYNKPQLLFIIIFSKFSSSKGPFVTIQGIALLKDLSKRQQINDIN